MALPANDLADYLVNNEIHSKENSKEHVYFEFSAEFSCSQVTRPGIRKNILFFFSTLFLHIITTKKQLPLLEPFSPSVHITLSYDLQSVSRGKDRPPT